MASSFLIYIPYELDEVETEDKIGHYDGKKQHSNESNKLVHDVIPEESSEDLSNENETASEELASKRGAPLFVVETLDEDDRTSDTLSKNELSENAQLLAKDVEPAIDATKQETKKAESDDIDAKRCLLPKSSSRKSIDKGRFEVVRASSEGADVDNGGSLPIPRKDMRKPSLVTALINAEDAELEEVTTEVLTLRDALRDLLTRLQVDNDIWSRSDDGNEWQINFVVDSQRCDKVLHAITAAGFGRIAETSVSVFPASFHYGGSLNKDSDSSSESSAKKEFIKSIKSRLTVAQVVGAVKSNATLTFDFLVLIFLASMIAGFGLAESSSVALVASMLISPLMGPIIGFTFGIVVKNRDLWTLGVRNELIGLSICLGYGFIFGLVTGGINSTGANWGATDSWPTPEMSARGKLRSLWVGVLIALPSGAGVALSILGGNTGSLVGVAISASLLPPAVNAGMLWGFAVISSFTHAPLQNDNSTEVFYVPNCPPLQNNDYEFEYVCDIASEAAILGSVSLLLTILNIICIFIMGIIVLKVKEIAPHTAMSPATEAFWKKDIPIVRNTYKTLKGRECADMAARAKQFIAEFKASNTVEELDSVLEDLKHDPTFNEVADCMPAEGRPSILRQLSLTTHEMLRSKSDGTDPTSPIIDQTYHTVISGSSAQRLMQRSPHAVAMHSAAAVRSHGAAGSVVRMRLKSCEDSSPDSPGGASKDELMIIDCGHLRERRRSNRVSRSTLGPPKSPLSQFQVTDINEEQPSTEEKV